MWLAHATSTRKLKRAAFRGAITGFVVAGHLALALLMLTPPSSHLPALAIKPAWRGTILRVTLIYPPPTQAVPRMRRTPPATASVQPHPRARHRPHAQREGVAERNQARSVRRIMGALLESPPGLVHLAGESKAPGRYAAPLASELQRLASGRLALRLPNLPGAPCFILPQHFKDPNHHGLHLLALSIAAIITPPKMLPYVMKQISVPNPQPVACRPLPAGFNRVLDLPAENLLAPGKTRIQPGLQGRFQYPAPGDRDGHM